MYIRPSCCGFPPAHTEAVSVVVKPTTPPDLQLLTHLFLAAVDRGGEWAGLTLRPRNHGSIQLHRYVRIDGILLASAAEKGSGVAGTIPVLAEQRVG